MRIHTYDSYLEFDAKVTTVVVSESRLMLGNFNDRTTVRTIVYCPIVVRQLTQWCAAIRPIAGTSQFGVSYKHETYNVIHIATFLQ
jgi:hypothetical protein